MHYIEVSDPLPRTRRTSRKKVSSSSGRSSASRCSSRPSSLEVRQFGRWVSSEAGLISFAESSYRKMTLDCSGSLRPPGFFDGDPQLLKLAIQAYALGTAYEFDP
jgi:hypothetical protein